MSLFNRYVAVLNYSVLAPLGLVLQPRRDTESVYETLRKEQYRLADAQRQIDDLRSTLKQLSPINLSPDTLYEMRFSRESLDNKRFYNFGSGTWRHRYWTNVDYDSIHYNYRQDLIDIHWDIALGGPVSVESNSAELVYSSHTIEHLLDEHVDHMLREAHRILKPGGVMRVTTPNAALIYWAFKRRDVDFNRHYGNDFGFGEDARTFSIERMPIWIVNEVATQLVQGVHGEDRVGAKLLENTAAINQIFDRSKTMEEFYSTICGMIDFELQREVPGHHVNWWTNQKLEEACRRAGFPHTVVNVPGGSISPVMRNRDYFDLVDSTFSLFVDAIK